MTDKTAKQTINIVMQDGALRTIRYESWDVENGCLWTVSEMSGQRIRTVMPLHTIDHFWMELPPKEPDPWVTA